MFHCSFIIIQSLKSDGKITVRAAFRSFVTGGARDFKFLDVMLDCLTRWKFYLKIINSSNVTAVSIIQWTLDYFRIFSDA